MFVVECVHVHFGVVMHICGNYDCECIAPCLIFNVCFGYFICLVVFFRCHFYHNFNCSLATFVLIYCAIFI